MNLAGLADGRGNRLPTPAFATGRARPLPCLILKGADVSHPSNRGSSIVTAGSLAAQRVLAASGISAQRRASDSARILVRAHHRPSFVARATRRPHRDMSARASRALHEPLRARAYPADLAAADLCPAPFARLVSGRNGSSAPAALGWWS